MLENVTADRLAATLIKVLYLKCFSYQTSLDGGVVWKMQHVNMK